MNPIATHFADAAGIYHQHAPVQAACAAALAQTCKRVFAEERLADPETILELGCGPGILTRHVREVWPKAAYLATDIALPMLEQITPADGLSRIVMDAGKPMIMPESINLITSSFALQWLPKIVPGIAQLRSLLKENGRLIVALPIHGSLAEWGDLCTSHGISSGLWPYPTKQDFAVAMPTARLIETPIIHEYASAAEFLRALKNIGATTPPPEHRPTPIRKMREVLNTAPRPFPITYNVLTIVAPPC